MNTMLKQSKLLFSASIAFALMLLTGCSGGTSPPSSATGAANPAVRTTPTPDATTAATTKSTPAKDASMPSKDPANSAPTGTELAMFGGGCFWGVEHIFAEDVPGVLDAVSGYSGGHVDNPTYKQVSYEDTGHVEVVQITFDPTKVTYEQLVNFFYRMIDPTQVNGQGPDRGSQYRSVVFSYNDAQKEIAEKVKAQRQLTSKRPIAVVTEPAQKFYKAEDYHQNYYVKTGKQPYCHVLRPE